MIIFDLRGQGSDSEGEELGREGEVILPQDLPGCGNIHSQQSVIKLSEVISPAIFVLKLIAMHSNFIE